MASIEITEIIKTLQTKRAQTQKELAKLDKVISALRELSLTNLTANTNGKRRNLSAAARRKVGRAQKARWAKVRRERATKA